MALETACEECHALVRDVGAWVTRVYKRQPQEEIILCKECLGKQKGSLAFIQQKRWVMVTNIIPRTAQVVVTGLKPVLAETNFTCWDTAQIKSEQTKDRTSYSSFCSLEGAKVGKDVSELEDLDRPIKSGIEVKKLLLSHLSAVPYEEGLVLESQDKERKLLN